MQFPTVSDIIISKPKKDGSTYLASIAYQRKKNVCEVHVENASCIPSTNAFLLKSKGFMDFMSDLNEHVIEVVKSNCGDWFNNNMSLDLIDEYYANPMKYDKVHGYTVKIKYDGSVPEGKVNVKLQLTGLRFLKQKFNLEWTVESIESAGDFEFDMMESFDSDSDVSSEDDIPEPDISEIKAQYIHTLSDVQKKLIQSQERIATELASVENALSKVRNASTLKALNEIYESFIEFLQ